MPVTDAPTWAQALTDWPGAAWLLASGTAYLFVNAAHILGIGLLVGTILPLDVRLVAGRGSTALGVLAPWSSRVAACGLVLTVLTGAWLFTVQPVHYLNNPAFLYKMLLLAIAMANVAWQHLTPGLAVAWRAERIPVGVRVRAAVSCAAWLATLIAGRWIGFV